MHTDSTCTAPATCCPTDPCRVLAHSAPPRRKFPYELARVGAIVQLYPEPTHEGPHPDDEFTPPGATCRVVEIERHPNNPDFIWSIRLVDLEDGVPVMLRYQASARGEARPLGAIHRILRQPPTAREQARAAKARARRVVARARRRRVYTFELG